MRWTIRDAGPGDAEAIVALAHALDRAEGKKPGPLTAAGLRVEMFGERPRLWAVLAEQDGRALGFASYFPSYDTEHAARGFYLNDLFVVPEARRQGIGRALVAAVAQRCRREGGCYLFWNALESNRAGRAFYRAIGAREEPVVTLSLQPAALERLASQTPSDSD